MASSAAASSSSSSSADFADTALSKGWLYIPGHKNQVTTHRLPNGDKEIHVHFPTGTKVVLVENSKGMYIITSPFVPPPYTLCGANSQADPNRPTVKPVTPPVEEDDDWTIVPVEGKAQCVAGNVKAQRVNGVRSIISRVFAASK